MSGSKSIENSIDIIAEHFRLSLDKLSQLKLPFTPTNYALIYYYISDVDAELNARLEELFEDLDNWTDEAALEIFSKFICRCNEDRSILVPELLMIIAQIIGIVVDISGKTALSKDTLESRLEALAESNDPKMILSVASDIIAETRVMVDETRNFESSLQQTTQEIQSLKIKLDSARKQATSDALTGLNNRRGFNTTLSDTLKSARRRKTDFCLLILDIDHFKAVNDEYGHLVGDKVLAVVAKQLSNMVRGNDYLARYGGEEFAIILPETPITGAFTVAENIRRTIDSLRLKHTTTGKKIGKVTISIGLACYVSKESAEDLVSRCDSALYKAKSLGRNRTIIAD